MSLRNDRPKGWTVEDWDGGEIRVMVVGRRVATYNGTCWWTSGPMQWNHLLWLGELARSVSMHGIDRTLLELQQ